MPTCVTACRTSNAPSSGGGVTVTKSDDECFGNLYDGAAGVQVLDSSLKRYKPTSQGGGIMHDFWLWAERVGPDVNWEYGDNAGGSESEPTTGNTTISASTVFSLETLMALIPACGAKWVGHPHLPSEYMLAGFVVDEVIINDYPLEYTHSGTYVSENPGEQLILEVTYSGPEVCQACVS